MAKHAITEAYLDGIKEGRQFLEKYPDACPVHEYEICKELARTHSNEMKDMFRGQRDFWKNQMEKGTNQ